MAGVWLGDVAGHVGGGQPFALLVLLPALRVLGLMAARPEDTARVIAGSLPRLSKKKTGHPLVRDDRPEVPARSVAGFLLAA